MRGLDDFDDYEDYETEDDWWVDNGDELWHLEDASGDHPICPFDVGDSNNLCVKDLYGCHFIGCEFADD